MNNNIVKQHKEAKLVTVGVLLFEGTDTQIEKMVKFYRTQTCELGHHFELRGYYVHGNNNAVYEPCTKCGQRYNDY